MSRSSPSSNRLTCAHARINTNTQGAPDGRRRSPSLSSCRMVVLLAASAAFALGGGLIGNTHLSAETARAADGYSLAGNVESAATHGERSIDSGNSPQPVDPCLTPVADPPAILRGRQVDTDFGDAPEGAIAYPTLGINGAFPTCLFVGPASWIQHTNFGAFFGPAVDFEVDGNAGFCPFFTPNQYDMDECFMDADAGLLLPDPYTIQGPAGAEVVVPCPNSVGTPLGNICANAQWGVNVDIDVHNHMPGATVGYVNVLMDWDQNGSWAGAAQCPAAAAPEHVLVNFPVPNPFDGPLSALGPPGFLIGPNSGYVWTRFTITELPVTLPWVGDGAFEDGETEDYLLEITSIPMPENDLGDAPDSSNNAGVGMTAYPPGGPLGVPAIYPTVYLTGSPPFGPIHWQPQAVAYLGGAVTLEDEADIGLDQDPTNNIDSAFDVPDLDLADDGVIFPLVLPHCRPTTFDYVVTVTNPVVNDFYVNVWFDWTRDGDWDDVANCTGGVLADEWAVQNQLVSVAAVGSFTITTPQFIPWHPNSGNPMQECWMRITLSEQPWVPGGAAPGYGGSGPANGYQYGETEDYYFMPVIFEPKWSQLPHGPDEGFDDASDLWWTVGWPPNAKWHQDYDTSLSALHAHDGPVLGERIILANDWLCFGGLVTDLHWWGGIETPGSGLWGFHLSIHANDPVPCLPLDPALWEADVPIAQINVVNTGATDPTGLPIMLYEYNLPIPFSQTAGERYWFDVSAISNDPNFNVVWKWAQSSPAPVLCPAAQKHDTPFSPGIWSVLPPGSVELAFAVTSEAPAEPPNKVVADDFTSDGRPIERVHWWGSYLDPLFEPVVGQVNEPFVIDGWLISFHHKDPVVNPNCPPDLLAGDPHPTVLGIYFAPSSAVATTSLNYFDCMGHPVYEYEIDLSQCCLVCSEPDPRDGGIPAVEGAFNEVTGFGYWLDIQAVVGIEWQPIGPAICQPVLTGHLPSPTVPGGHFWGWHTSPGPNLPCTPMNDACGGQIVDFTPYPPACWDYGNWVKEQWQCPTPPEPVNMAFELLTSGPDPCPCPGDVNGDGVVNGLDIQDFCDCVLGNPVGPGVNCACCDFNCSKLPDIGDVQGFVAELLSTTVCP